jgi:formate dehydrogenase major subunit
VAQSLNSVVTNCPEYKVTAVQVVPSNGPSDWQEEYEELAERSRRIVGHMEAAE